MGDQIISELESLAAVNLSKANHHYHDAAPFIRLETASYNGQTVPSRARSHSF